MAKTRGVMKRKQGKNKKKTWKQIQHKDVEKFLDDAREDERLGGIRSKTNDELFAIDDFTEAELMSKNIEESPKVVVRNKSGPLVPVEDLKCFHLLKPHTAVKDPVVKRNRLRRRGEKKSDVMAKKDEVRQSKKTVASITPKEKCLDPWGMEEPTTHLDSEWIEPSIKRHNLRPRPSKPKLNVTSELPAVEVPHPGFSYNPSFQDHQDLLKKAVTSTQLSLKKEKSLNKAVAPTKCPTVDKSETESEGEDFGEFQEDIKPNIVPKSKAKTRQQKRKERDEKEKNRLLRQKKQENVRMNEVFRIKSIQKSIAKNETKQKAKLAKAVQKKIANEKFGQKKISKFKYEELSLDPALRDEIQGSLVSVQAHNRLVLERFNSLQKRNIVEPRIKQRMKRKLRVKKFQKSVDKMEWEKTGYWNGIKIATEVRRRK